jgi:DNA-binding transcriptional MerR regulator
VPGLTIEALADRVGMTPRNIRAHQSRGLLPPPTRSGRIAYYGEEHAQVLLRIKELQARGYNLAAIAALLAEDGDDHSVMLQRVVLAPIVGNDEVVLTWSEIAGMFDQEPSPERHRRAVESGFVRITGDGDIAAPSLTLLHVARGLIDVGVPFDVLFDMMIEVVGETGDIARRFVELCLQCAMAPYGDDPVPADKWDDVRDRFEELYQRMTSVLAGSFAISVRRATEDLLAERSRTQAVAGD